LRARAARLAALVRLRASRLGRDSQPSVVRLRARAA